MKRWLVFLLGTVVGIVLTVAVLYLMAACSSANNGVTYFEKPGDCISTKSLEVFQVLDQGVALANETDDGFHTGLVVLLIDENGKYYYDDQVIEIPEGKCARQVGVYTYPTKMEIERTVPIVEIME